MSEQFPNDRRFGSSSSSKGKATSNSLEQENNEECLMRDIFQVLSEIPLNATETSHNYNYEQHLEEDKGETKLHENMQIFVQGCQTDQRRAREQRRRETINAKLRERKALIPGLDKEDQASILDGAIKYINSLKLQLQVLSVQRSSGGIVFQPTYMTPVMHTSNIPWPQFQMTTPYNSGIPMMISPPGGNFMSQPNSQVLIMQPSTSVTPSPDSTPPYSQQSTSSETSYQTYNYNHELFDF